VDSKVAFSLVYNLPGTEYDEQPCSKLLTKPKALWLTESRTAFTRKGW